MDQVDFTPELNSDDLPKTAEYKLYTQAEERLRRLAADHQDMVGAAINVRRPASGESAFLHEVTVVIYGRPEHIAATEKNRHRARLLDQHAGQFRARQGRPSRPMRASSASARRTRRWRRSRRARSRRSRIWNP